MLHCAMLWPCYAVVVCWRAELQSRRAGPKVGSAVEVSRTAQWRAAGPADPHHLTCCHSHATQTISCCCTPDPPSIMGSGRAWSTTLQATAAPAPSVSGCGGEGGALAGLLCWPRLPVPTVRARFGWFGVA